jgi:hypothetical protein
MDTEDENTADVDHEQPVLPDPAPVGATERAWPASVGAGAPGGDRGAGGGLLGVINGVLVGIGGVYAVSSSILVTGIAAVVVVVVIALVRR